MGKITKHKSEGKMESKEVAVKSPSLPTLPPEYMNAGPHIGADDLVVPKILPIHYISKKAKGKEKIAEAGELRDSIENKLFGSTEHPFDFLPIHMTTFWVEYDMKDGGQGKYIGQFSVTAQNENLKREEVVSGVKIKRVKTWECYVLIPEDVKAGEAFPYVLSFRVTSARAGKTLLTQMYVKNRAAGKLPFQTVCELSMTEESNDSGDFFVQHVKPKRAATPEEMEAGKHWFEMINAGKVKKDDSDIHEGVATADAAEVDTSQF